jgi:hypothetical protein
MSHFTTIKTQFVAAAPLRKALADVRAEFNLGEVRENALVSGYHGNTARADLVVSTRNQGYDLGFRKQGEAYELVADWYGIRDFKQADLAARLTQRYAYHTVKEKLDQQGFSLVEEEVKQDKTIHLVLRRTV